MEPADLLLWLACASWAVTALQAIPQWRAGDASGARYLAMVAGVALAVFSVWPAAAAWVLGLLWVVTLLLPMLLLRLLPRWQLAGRPTTVLRLAALLRVLQPVGPLRRILPLHRYQALRELGRVEDAARLKAAVAPDQQVGRMLANMELAADQRWSELRERVRDQPTLEVGVMRLRAAAEAGADATATGEARAAALVAMLTEAEMLLPAFTNQRMRRQAATVRSAVLAFAGRPAQVAPQLARAGMAAAQGGYWLATATWAAGDEAAARAQLAALHDPAKPLLAAAIAWRLAHPPLPAAAWVVGGIAARVDALADDAVEAPRARPWLTWTVLALCVGLFALCSMPDVVLRVFDIDPSGDPEGDVAIATWALGALDTGLGWAGNWWRLVAASFLHAGIMHLALNGAGLLLLGPRLERGLGRWRFALLYLGAGVGGMALALAMADPAPAARAMVVGASTSLMGLVGAEAVRALRGRAPGTAWWRHEPVQRIALVIGLQVTFDLSHAQVSSAGHMGGLISGALLAAWLGAGRRGRDREA